MKKIKKNLKTMLSLTLCVLALALLFAGCSGTQTGEDSGDEITVGVIQFGSHPSLDNCYQGVENALLAAYGDKVVIDRQDGNFDSATCDSIAKNMVAKKYDILIPIATPAATAAYAAVQGTDIPVVFCAVSDPVAAGLVDSMDAPGGNCTGTSDLLNLDAQVELIRAFQPDVKSIGVLYTTSEANSLSQLASLKKVCEKAGISVVEQGVQTAADVPQAAASIVTKADCINNFTDNNVVSCLSTLVEQANNAKIPVYGSEVEQVINGCLASVSIDYVALGEKTGNMAVEILKGKDAGSLAIATISDGTPVVNTDVMAAFGYEMPASYKDAQTVKTGQADEN